MIRNYLNSYINDIFFIVLIIINIIDEVKYTEFSVIYSKSRWDIILLAAIYIVEYIVFVFVTPK
jgi:hypothetical protein